MCCFCFFLPEMKNNCYQVFHHFFKTNYKKRNKIKFESYGDLVDQAFSHSNENSINNQDSHIKIENDETPGATYPTENDLEDAKTNKISAISTFMPQITR